ncbi:MAG: hypothetical protein ACRCVN_03885 [Spirochaetia bacterium]
MKPSTKLTFILLFLGFGLALLYYFIQQAGYVSVDKLLVQVDQKITAGQYSEATRMLKKMKNVSLSRQNWLRILSRAYDLSKVEDDYSTLKIMGLRATKALPGAEEFWAFYVYALLRGKEYENAKNAAKNLHSETFLSMRAEALLSALHATEEDPLAYTESTLTTSADASYFQSVAQDMKSPILFYNTAILWLKAGYPERSRAILPWIGTGTQTPPLGRALIAYDSGNIDRALQEVNLVQELQSPSFDQVFLLANLNLTTGHYKQAYEQYNSALEMDPKGDWRVYQNLAILNWENNDRIVAVDLLSEGLELFSMQKNLLMTYAFYLKNDKQVQPLIEKYLEQNPLEPDIVIYNLHYFHGQTPPENQSSTLWNLYHKNTKLKSLVSYMIWFFLSNQNIQDAETVLAEYRKNNGSPEWADFCQGFIDVAKNQFEEALQKFATATPNGWEGPFNQGLIYLYLGNNASALEAFGRSEKAFLSRSNAYRSRKMLAKIYSQLALTSLYNQKSALARTFADKALYLDSSNPLGQRVRKETTL